MSRPLIASCSVRDRALPRGSEARTVRASGACPWLIVVGGPRWPGRPLRVFGGDETRSASGRLERVEPVAQPAKGTAPPPPRVEAPNAGKRTPGERPWPTGPGCDGRTNQRYPVGEAAQQAAQRGPDAPGGRRRQPPGP